MRQRVAIRTLLDLERQLDEDEQERMEDCCRDLVTAYRALLSWRIQRIRARRTYAPIATTRRRWINSPAYRSLPHFDGLSRFALSHLACDVLDSVYITLPAIITMHLEDVAEHVRMMDEMEEGIAMAREDHRRVIEEREGEAMAAEDGRLPR